MSSRPVLALYGVLWFACGMVIRLSRPQAGGWLALGAQLAGWLIAVTGVFALLTAISRSRIAITSPRRRLDGQASRRREIRLVATSAVAVAAGGWLLWWGLAGGVRSAFCLGLVVLSVAPILLVRAARSAHFGGDAAHRLS